MLLEGGLKLLCSVVVVVVGWFLARRKWRQRAARMEEIRRRLAFARQEALRVELEEAAGYSSYGSALAPEPAAEELVFASGSSSGLQFQYQCNVCFRPTTTRCKQCKAVHYCSRKCQTLHWRQGHKDECHLFIPHKNTDVGHSYLKEFKQDEMGSSQDVTGIEVTHVIKPVESLFGEHISDPILHVSSKNNDAETETSDDGKRTEINVKAPVYPLPGECSSSNTLAEKTVFSDRNLKDCNRYDGQSTSMNVESMKPLLSVRPSLTNPESHVAASNIPNWLNSGCADTDKSDFSTSSGSSVDVSEEDSLSEPSTSSDFFGGTVETIRSKIDALAEFSNVNMSNSRSPFLPTSGRSNGNVEIVSSEMNRVMGDDLCPAKSMPKESTASSEVSEDGLKSRELPISNCKLSGQNVVRTTPAEYSSEKEAKLYPSNAHREQITEGHVSNKHASDVSTLSSLAPKQLHHKIDQRDDSILDSMKCQENDSLRHRSSEAHLPSACTRKPAALDVHSVENGCDHRDAALSSDSNGAQSATSGINPSTRRPVDHLRRSHFIKHSSLVSGSGIVGRYEGSFSYELFVKLYNWNVVELCPRGLKNCGNSCYANAVLQSLAFTPPLTAYFLQGLHAKACQKKDWCFTCDFEALVKKAKEGNSPVSPAHIMSRIQHIGSHLGNGREEDAHEFLRYAIEAMQSVCLKDVGVNVPNSFDEETTLLGLTFGGYLQSKIECMRCGSRSRQHERIMDLTVEIGGEIGTLEDALRQFTQPEDLDGENKYHCGRCKSYEKAKKKLGVLVAPNVLTIVLKRFQSGKFGKLNKAVKYPKILNLGSYMSGTSDKFPVYQLYGVVVHIDVMNATFSGHYVCYIKNNRGKWFKADDSLVQPVDVEKVLSNDAYMLFYARCSPRAPKLLRSSVIKAKGLTSSISTSHPWGNVSGSGLRSSSLDSSSEHSSLFSDVGSYSTEESSKRDSSISTDDYLFDQILGCESPDLDRCYSSDAETTSSSSCSINTSSNMDGFWDNGSNRLAS